MAIKRAKSGDPLVISASDWNAVGDAVEDIRRIVREGRGNGTSGDDGWRWIKIQGSPTVVAADQKWTYTAKTCYMKSFSSSSEFPLIEIPGATAIKAVNTWELLNKAGYENGSVTKLKAIPANAIVRAQLYARGSEFVFVFSERNEPECA
jgi:hypothetical protein